MNTHSSPLDEVEMVEQEILVYLRSSATASDTLDGIASWWLMKQRISEKLILVEKALEQLEMKGSIKSEENELTGKRYYLDTA